MKSIGKAISFLMLSIIIYNISGWEFKTNYKKERKMFYEEEKPFYVDGDHYMFKMNDTYTGLVNNHKYINSPFLQFLLLLAAAYSFDLFLMALVKSDNEEKDTN